MRVAALTPSGGGGSPRASGAVSSPRSFELEGRAVAAPGGAGGKGASLFDVAKHNGGAARSIDPAAFDAVANPSSGSGDHANGAKADEGDET